MDDGWCFPSAILCQLSFDNGFAGNALSLYPIVNTFDYVYSFRREFLLYPWRKACESRMFKVNLGEICHCEYDISRYVASNSKPTNMTSKTYSLGLTRLRYEVTTCTRPRNLPMRKMSGKRIADWSSGQVSIGGI